HVGVTANSAYEEFRPRTELQKIVPNVPSDSTSSTRRDPQVSIPSGVAPRQVCALAGKNLHTSTAQLSGQVSVRQSLHAEISFRCARTRAAASTGKPSSCHASKPRQS